MDYIDNSSTEICDAFGNSIEIEGLVEPLVTPASEKWLTAFYLDDSYCESCEELQDFVFGDPQTLENFALWCESNSNGAPVVSFLYAEDSEGRYVAVLFVLKRGEWWCEELRELLEIYREEVLEDSWAD